MVKFLLITCINKMACCSKGTPSDVCLFCNHTLSQHRCFYVATTGSARAHGSALQTRLQDIGVSHTYHPSAFMLTVVISDMHSISLETLKHPLRGPETALERLLRLDTATRPGLTKSEFKRLFANCACGLIMTCRVFNDHICQVPQVVIDLTLDNDAGEGDDVIDLTSN